MPLPSVPARSLAERVERVERASAAHFEPYAAASVRNCSVMRALDGIG
jgi:hypothetical protein